MKNFVFSLILSTFATVGIAQTGWKNTLSDSLTQKLCFIESYSDGNFYSLTFDYSQSGQNFLLSKIDSGGFTIGQISFTLGTNVPKIKSFSIDTVQQKLVVISQSEDVSNYEMRMTTFDYSLIANDSLLFMLSKTNIDSLNVAGGGLDNFGDKFIIYTSRDINDQIWSRAICKKNASGTIKTNTVKVGQASNDGFYINDCIVTPTGSIYIGGSRKESLYGNYFYFEKLNASMATIFEVKEQLVTFNTENNHVSSIHVYTTTSASHVVVGGTIFGLAPGDTVNRCHGIIRSYTYNGVLRWNYENLEVRDYKKVIGKNSYVHAIGTNNVGTTGLDTKITRLFIKDGVVDWNRYFGSKSTPNSLIIEKDGSLLIGGDKLVTIPKPGGGNLSARTYMLIRYSKYGKKLYDFNNAWTIPSATSFVSGMTTDIACGKNGQYFIAGYNRMIYNNGVGNTVADSISFFQFTNGALRYELPAKSDIELTIRPNPATSEITFDCNFQILDMMVINSTGAKTPIEELSQDGSSYHCNISMLSPGIYILKVRTEKGWEAKPFIKK